MPAVPLQSEGAVQIETPLAPHFDERDFLAVLLDPPAGAELIQTEAERRPAVLKVKGLGLIHQAAAHPPLQRDDRIQRSDSVVEDVAPQLVVQGVLIGQRRCKDGQTQSLGGRAGPAKWQGGFADQSVVTQLIDGQMALMGIHLTVDGRVDRLLAKSYKFLKKVKTKH